MGSSFYSSKEREEGRAEVVRDRALFVLVVVHMRALGGLAPRAQKEYHGGYIVVFRDMNADILRLSKICFPEAKEGRGEHGRER